MKYVLTSAPVLRLPTLRGKFRLDTDACNASIGAVLTETVDGEDHVVAYASKVLSESEKRWPTYDKELWAIVWSIRHFRQYLVGSPFIVCTDHRHLKNLPKSIVIENDATGRRGRWAVELSSYEFEVEVRPGESHGNADVLSQRPIRGEVTQEVAPDVQPTAGPLMSPVHSVPFAGAKEQDSGEVPDSPNHNGNDPLDESQHQTGTTAVCREAEDQARQMSRPTNSGQGCAKTDWRTVQEEDEVLAEVVRWLQDGQVHRLILRQKEHRSDEFCEEF